MIKKFTTDCDMGSIKIFSEEWAVFYANSCGDLPTIVNIKTTPHKAGNPWPKGKFLSHFTVRAKDTVHLSFYDCDDIPAYTFGIGRWFVTLVRRGEFFIEFVDKETHS